MPVIEYQLLKGVWTIATTPVVREPNPPASLVATTPGTPGSKQATATWVKPADNGSPITSYSPSLTPAPSVALPTLVSAAATSLLITGLADGVSYTFRLIANNSVGPSAPASTNFAADAAGTGVPAAPVNLRVTTPGTSGSKVATANWTAPSNGGSAITSYTITLTLPHGTLPTLGASATSASLTGLADATSYTLTIAAVNANGTGPAATATFRSDPAVVVSGSRFAGDPGKNKTRLGTNTGKYNVTQFESQIGTRGPTTTPDGYSNPYYTPHTTIVREYNTAFGPNWTVIDAHIAANRIALFSWLNGAYTMDALANDLGTASGGTATGDSINSDLATFNTQAASRAPHAIWFSFYHEPEDNFTTAASQLLYRKAFRRIVLAINASNVAWVGPIYMDATFKNETTNGRDWKTWNPDWDATTATWLSPSYDLEGVDVYNPGPGSVTMKTWDKLISDRYRILIRDNAPIRPYVIAEYGVKSDYSQAETPDMYFNETLAEAPLHQGGDGGCVGIIMWNTWTGTQTSPGPSFDSVGDPTGQKCAGFRWITRDSKVVTTVP